MAHARLMGRMNSSEQDLNRNSAGWRFQASIERELGRLIHARPCSHGTGRSLRVAALLVLFILLFDGALCAQNNGGGQGGTALTSEGNNALSNLRVSGFLSETFGTWIDSEAIEYSKSKNSLSAERNWLQVDVNDDIVSNNEFSDSFFLRSWGVYEPVYPFETNGNTDFYNDYGIRELWIKHSQGFLNLFIGRQIVTWGESISFRVGDQINPQDTSFAFGFANLEQSRLPLWMIHPIIEIPDPVPPVRTFSKPCTFPASISCTTMWTIPTTASTGRIPLPAA